MLLCKTYIPHTVIHTPPSILILDPVKPIVGPQEMHPWWILFSKGDAGFPGDDGDKGLTGEDGEAGQKGERPVINPIPEMGRNGEKGSNGTQGSEGQKGEKGQKGDGPTKLGTFC